MARSAQSQGSVALCAACSKDMEQRWSLMGPSSTSEPTQHQRAHAGTEPRACPDAGRGSTWIPRALCATSSRGTRYGVDWTPPLDNPTAHVVTLGHPSGGHTELPFSVAALIIAFAGEFDETLTPPHYYLELYRILQCLCHVAPYVARVLAQINQAHHGYCVLLPHGWRREARMRTPSPHVISTSPSPEVIAIESSPEL